MLRECKSHGYFRGEACPICGEKGRFLMNEKELDQIGRTMAGVLRHFPEKFGLKMDSQGFVSLKDFVNALRTQQRRYHWIRPYHIIAIIETDPKGRYEVSNDMIRATYGHTIELDLKLPTDNTPEKLYYPTTPEEADIILETGLKPSDRKLVHLSKTYKDAVIAGSVRTDSPVILEIDAKKAVEDGIVIQRAGKTVFLVEEVPACYLKRAESTEEVRE
ncbi:MAG: RNA 2'-phosphotransferase [Methanomassiliicoccales archaeon]|jgi:putative RNA 2'-phosphotransferase|nr:RNA 2'-phosphotransferase [Methanomassiliicoccales archaeon]